MNQDRDLGLRQQTILLVGGEPPARRLAKEVLQGAGYMVVTAQGAAEALAIGERLVGRIDLLLIGHGVAAEIADRLARTRPAMKVLRLPSLGPSAAELLRAVDETLR